MLILFQSFCRTHPVFVHEPNNGVGDDASVVLDL